MDLKQLRTFLTVVSLESFNKAADALGLAQSTVSDQIRSLEGELGRLLIQRETRRLSLTPAGEIVRDHAQAMVKLDAQLRSELDAPSGPRGTLTMRIPETVSICWLPPVLQRFQARFPLVELTLHSCSYFGLVEELRSGLTNLAFLITDEFRAPDVETCALRPVSLALVCGPGDPLAAGPALGLADLRGRAFFAPTSDCDYFKILERRMIEAKLKFGALRRTNSVEAIKRNVAAGNGCALLSRDVVAAELATGALIELSLDQGPLEATLLMIWQRGSWQAPILKAFMEMMREGLAATMAPAGRNRIQDALPGACAPARE